MLTSTNKNEQIANLALLPGLERGLTRTLEEYNFIVQALGLPPMELTEGRKEGSRSGRTATNGVSHANGAGPGPVALPSPATQAPAKRVMSVEASKKLSAAAKKRWSAARKAGNAKL